MKYKNYGLIHEDPKPEDWILGASPLDNRIIFDDGKGWRKFAPDGEMQFNRKFDSYSCVSFASLKALNYYFKVVYNIELDLSEMFTAVMSGTIPGRGNTVRNVLESIRKDGFVEEFFYPFTEATTKAQFFTPPPLTIKTRAKGKLQYWQINWEWVDSSTDVSHETIKDALKYSPVIVTGYAWTAQDGVYYDNNRQANHCFLVVDYDEQGRLIADDSYPTDWQYDDNSSRDEFYKTLDKNFRLWSAHKITVTPILKKNKTLLEKIKSMFKNISRDIHGGLWFIKGGKKQKILDIESLSAALVDEIGVEKNDLTDADLAKYPDHKFFGK